MKNSGKNVKKHEKYDQKRVFTHGYVVHIKRRVARYEFDGMWIGQRENSVKRHNY